MTLVLTGVVERVVFSSSDSLFAVARFRLEGVENQRTYDDLTTIVGDLGRLAEGEVLRVGGEWERHAKHGRHFRVQWLEQRLPSTAIGIQRFLGSGIIKGVGPVTAERVVAFFGDETMHVIESQPERLRDVPKLSGKRADLIVKGWREHHQVRDLMIFLQSHNLPSYLARRLREQYGDEAVSVLQADPYRLVHEVYGVGFKTADALARNLGLPLISTSRFVAGISYVLDEAAQEGHVFLPRAMLLERAAGLLEVTTEAMEPALLESSRTSMTVLDEDRVYRAGYYYAERNAATRLQHIELGPSFIHENFRLDPVSSVKRAISSLGLRLAVKQMEALTMALTQKVSVITGGPGTGKTTCLLAVITALDQAGVPYSLCAPTGRAAKRMASATGRQASTIHRLLSFQPSDNSFAFNADNQLDPRMVIVDELSMVDILLFHSLLNAVTEDSHLLFVGDSDQLPSVGAGNVLADLLASESVSRVELDELFRQAEGSDIDRAAHMIRRGKVPEQPVAGGDLYLTSVPNAERAQTVIEELVTRRIPNRFGLDPTLDVQVLSPIHRGPAGVSQLNARLQHLLNGTAPGPHLDAGQLRLHAGDKVMQVRNNYDKEVFNGDVGLVLRVDPEAVAITVRFGETVEVRDVDYDISEMSELMLAYAVTVHKAQGSEFPCVIVPVLTAHFPLLRRNLVYTALTRAKRLCVVVHQPKALGMAVRSERRDQRYSYLTERLASPTFIPSVEFSAEAL